MPSSAQAERYLLVVDQFEEIFTTRSDGKNERISFFAQLDAALKALPALWILLSMREEHVAALEPYRSLLPNRLSARYYMTQLSYSAAISAVQKPAHRAGRRYTDDAANKLVESLCTVPDQEQEAGVQHRESVEPVQLQVVCRQLWEELRQLPEWPELDDSPDGAIQTEHLQRVAGTTDLAEFVDHSLARFYQDGLYRTIAATEVPELDLRKWFEEELITETGTRNQVFRGSEKTGALRNEVIEELAKTLLIHAEVRPAGNWYELIHDRMVSPILKDNQEWYRENPLILLAYDWDQDGRKTSKLLEGQHLQDALGGNWQSLGSLVGEYLNQSRKADDARHQAHAAQQARLELKHKDALLKETEARRQAQADRAKLAEDGQKKQEVAANRLRWLASALVVATLIALVALLLAFDLYQSEQHAHREAQAAESKAKELFGGLLAVESERLRTTKPQLSLLLAVEAIEASTVESQSPVTKTVAALRQALTTTTSTPLFGQGGEVITDTTHLAVSPHHDWLAAGGADGVVYLWKLRDERPTSADYQFSAERGLVTALAFDANGELLVSGHDDGKVGIVDLPSPRAGPTYVDRSDRRRWR